MPECWLEMKELEPTRNILKHPGFLWPPYSKIQTFTPKPSWISIPQVSALFKSLAQEGTGHVVLSYKAVVR